jgi:hypothetical protein
MRNQKLSTRSIMLVVIMISWMLIACSLSGCGPSGRDLSDQQWLEMQQQLHAERSEVGHQRDLLEADRREWDDRERSEPVLAAVISASVLLVCCVLPLLLVGVLLWPRKPEPSSDAVCEILLAEQVDAVPARRLGSDQHPKRLANRKR